MWCEDLPTKLISTRINRTRLENGDTVLCREAGKVFSSYNLTTDTDGYFKELRFPYKMTHYFSFVVYWNIFESKKYFPPFFTLFHTLVGIE